ncbi:MAG: proline dehydrogenase family protein [Planctomycetota bacterium]|jgi:proline dehydrogenase
MSLLHRLVVSTLPLVPRSIVARVAKRYIAGESLDEAVETVRRLHGESCTTTLDVLGEFITSMDQARTTTEDYTAALAALAAADLTVNVSVKLTAFGLLLDEAECGNLVEGLVRDAASKNGFVRIDMEDSPCTDATLALHDRLRAEGLPVGTVLQARLHRTPDDCRRYAAEGASIRLCKGIYLEPEEIAHTGFDEIRTAYLESLEILLEGDGHVGIATHDDFLVEGSERLIREMRIPKERYEFQMLLGVLPGMRRRLVAEGHPLRVYVPYGTEWYAYSTRRLRENPQVAGHVLKAMFRGD